jgi:pyruvate dehydrogenase E2 component (dihydrolipoamide acetyltransferase)
MAASFSTAPHFYLSTEARADALLELRERLLPAVELRSGVRLTVTDLLIKTVAAALAEHPRANAFWDPTEGGRIGLHRQIHIGVAVATDAGLVVPVLRNSDSMGLAQIAAERNRLVEKARRGALLPGDLEGSTFTVTNLGMYRVDLFQAILNPPQSAILAVGRIIERPVAIEAQACVRPTMVVTLSCDHRVLDGILGAQFLGRVVELIEEPLELMA